MYRVGIIGYGTVGKRVTDAVLRQPDMELVGISAHSYNYRIDVANQKGIPIYAMNDITELSGNGIQVKGSIKNLLSNIDVVVDCTPKKIGKANKENYYVNYPNLKAIYQGGEKAEIGKSFVAQCNYNESIGQKHVRVVSCNTTGLARTLHTIDTHWPIQRVRATLIRRGTDPADSDRGPINAIVPSLELPFHHGPDVRTVLPNIEVFTTAVVVPTTLMHMHNLSVDLKEVGEDTKGKMPTADDVIEVFKKAPRIRVVKSSSGIISTAEIMEYAKDLGNHRGDMMDICVWEKGLGIHGKELFYAQAVHQESNIVPENIDAIRAAMGFEDGEESIRITNRTLGLKERG